MNDTRDRRLDKPEAGGPAPAAEEASPAELLPAADPDPEIAPAYAAWRLDRGERTTERARRR